jgi:hypothetical protein
VAVLAVVLVGAGLRLGPGDSGRPVERAAVPASGTVSSASPVSPMPASTPSAIASPRPSTAATRPGRTTAQRAAGLRADGTAYRVPGRGSGRFTVATRSRPPSARAGRLIRFDVRVERGLAVDADQAALLMAAVLDDDRSWGSTDHVRFRLVPRGARADLHAYLATPRTTDRLCAPLLTRGKVSCQNGRHIVLNAARWVHGAPAFRRDTAGYRRYLVNHEFGHALGHQHVGCPGRGRLAPVMLQQTKGLQGCRANPWPERTRG